MERRKFVRASLLGCSVVAGLVPAVSAASNVEQVKKRADEEFYEIRVYTLKNEAQQNLVEGYFKNAAIPALNRLGSKPVGVFRELEPEGISKIYTIIPYKSLADFAKVKEKLAKDAAYTKAGAAYLNAPAKEPAYERIESSLLKAFAQMPEIAVPEKKPRIFELRRYESASESAGKKKIEMFNKGEIDIFKRTGLTPVFFGETLIGELRPNLTYMLTFDDMAESKRNWKTFIDDPEWKKMSSLSEYANTVSNITSTFLTPAPFSQI